MIFYKLHCFLMFNGYCHRERMQKRQYFRPVFEIATSQFADNERVADNTAVI